MERIERSATEFRQFLAPLGYKRKKVTIQAAETVSLQDLNWSGGTRNTYTVFTVGGERVNDTARYSAMAPWVNVAEGKSLPLPEGFIVIRT